MLHLLASYEPSDPAEQGYRMQMLDLVAAAHDPFDRHHYTPGHVTASAFVLHPRGDRVLLVHHAKIGKWVQPGGHIDPGDEGPLAGAVREVAEETGVVDLEPVSPGIVDVDVHVFPVTDDQPEHRHFDVRFAFVAGDDRLAPSAEVLEARWAGSGDLENLGTDRSVTRPSAKLLGNLS